LPKHVVEIVKDKKSKFHLFRLAKSPIHGKGLFATTDIPKNTLIVQYTGQKIGRKEADIREDIHYEKGKLWLFEINRNWYIDAEIRGGIAKYVNHSKKPNCYTDVRKGEIWYRASKTIKKKEELTIDYCADLPGKPQQK